MDEVNLRSAWKLKTQKHVSARLYPDKWIVTNLFKVEIKGGELIKCVQARHGSSSIVLRFEYKRFLSIFKKIHSG